MKIALDGGALCSPNGKKFGNYIFTKNLVQAVKVNNKKDAYYLYTFKRNIEERELLKGGRHIIHKYLQPKIGWMKVRVSLEELVHEKDVFLALNQALPWMTHAKIISFSHGLSFYFYPDFYPKSYLSMFVQVSEMITRSQNIVVSSVKVKKEFRKYYPEYNKIKVLPFGIPYDFMYPGAATSSLVGCPYFMFAGMNHPIKNVDFLVQAFQEFIKDKKYSGYKLYLAGNFDQSQLPKNIKVISVPTRKHLKKLYQQATGYLAASFYESFNLPVLEALSQNCPVVGLETAIIPEMQEYTNIAKNQKGFVRLMKKIADGERKNIDHKKLRQEFSWDKYYQELVKLY